MDTHETMWKISHDSAGGTMGHIDLSSILITTVISLGGWISTLFAYTGRRALRVLRVWSTTDSGTLYADDWWIL